MLKFKNKFLFLYIFLNFRLLNGENEASDDNCFLNDTIEIDARLTNFDTNITFLSDLDQIKNDTNISCLADKNQKNVTIVFLTSFKYGKLIN